MGFEVDNRQTFAEYAEYVLKLKERTKKKHRHPCALPRAAKAHQSRYRTKPY